MIFHVLTLFPDMIKNGMNTSITGKAIEKGLMDLDVRNIRDYTLDKHLHVDDAPYGGGAGMVMQAEPIYRAYKDLNLKKKTRVIYVTPQGRVFNQQIAADLAKEEELVFLCVLDLVATDFISIGDYVLTGGELPAMVMMDAISRLVPGVLHNDESAQDESFSDNLLEYPQYTRPEVFEGVRVPDVLLSGHHANIAKWRREQSLLRTYERRPDLFNQVELNKKDKKFLMEQGIDLSKEKC